MPDFESRHNSKYWLCEPVFAFGVSAHSFDGKNRRYSNERDTAKYVELIERNESPVVEMNELTKAQFAGEYAFLHLRRSEGINLTEFYEKFGLDLKTRIRGRFGKTRIVRADRICWRSFKTHQKRKIIFE